MDPNDARALAEAVRAAVFAGADICLLAGSVARGEATSGSDLDLVVLFERVDHARRASFTFAGRPVEAFVHDMQTLDYFFRHVDRPAGVPSLATMVAEGVEIPHRTAHGARAKAPADRALADGPPPWGRQERDDSRYAIGDLVADLRGPRDPHEARAVMAALYAALARHHRRTRGAWAAKGKAIPRRLTAFDPALARRFLDAFETGFATGRPDAVIDVAERVLAPDGGCLFDGCAHAAPPAWRTPCTEAGR